MKIIILLHQHGCSYRGIFFFFLRNSYGVFCCMVESIMQYYHICVFNELCTTVAMPGTYLNLCVISKIYENCIRANTCSPQTLDFLVFASSLGKGVQPCRLGSVKDQYYRLEIDTVLGRQYFLFNVLFLHEFLSGKKRVLIIVDKSQRRIAKDGGNCGERMEFRTCVKVC